MVARKPGGKYKGKIERVKGEATIAAELEAKRRRAYEENLKRLQERRAAELKAKEGYRTAEEEEMELKLQKISQLFGRGKTATYRKFFKNWKVGVVAVKKEKALLERQTCWRRACMYCTEDGKPGQYGRGHTASCKHWWKVANHEEGLGEELQPAAAAADRHPDINMGRLCSCCGVDTGASANGCRAWAQLLDTDFERPFVAEQKLQLKRVQFTQASMSLGSGRSASTPAFASPRSPKMTLSAQSNMVELRRGRGDLVPEYDPTEPFVLSQEQARLEERKHWIDSLENTAGAVPVRRRLGRTGESGLRLTPLTMRPPAPAQSEKGEPLEQVMHWRTGQKTMLDNFMMKMYVVGNQK